MTTAWSKGPRHLKVFVKGGSEAERICRSYLAGKPMARRAKPPHAEAIAPGFTPHPELDLHDRGGKIIADLSFANFYVGASAWSPADMQQIDDRLSKAMADRRLNN